MRLEVWRSKRVHKVETKDEKEKKNITVPCCVQQTHGECFGLVFFVPDKSSIHYRADKVM